MMAGAGVDYAVFLISRYHDYLRQGVPSDEAVAKALTSIGKVIAGSAATVSITFLGHGIHPLGIVQERRSAFGDLHCVGVFRGRDLPSGADGVDRKARLDQATPRSVHPVLAAFGEYASCADPWSICVGSLVVLIILASCVIVCPLQLRRQQDPSDNPSRAPSATRLSAQHFPLNATIPEYLVVQSSQDLRKPAALVDLKQMEQRVGELPDIAAIHGAPVPSAKSTDKKSAADGHTASKARQRQRIGQQRPRGSRGIPQRGRAVVLGLQHRKRRPHTGSQQLESAARHNPADRPDRHEGSRRHGTFVNTVRGLGFAMSVDIAEIANTVNAAPVTVLDVVATADHDGGALKKMSEFAEQLESFPDAALHRGRLARSPPDRGKRSNRPPDAEQ